ncbi:MAG: sugar ABC transporter ATP-binding protein [Kiritimatiellaeota bacterium]|nr:sugar ABC transporter ATP-binding protein [Kiritimatiellota bacterium]
MSEPLLDIRELRKSYGRQEVLKGVNLTLARGERLALLGSNGAGKSTLVKIVAGDVLDWSGEIRFEGRPHRPHGPAEALDRGVTLMYQELEVLPDVSVAENIVVGQEAGFAFSRRETRERAAAALARVGAEVPLDAPCGRLTPASQQLVMLARAVCHDSKLLILDEPTALLTEPEIDRLFNILDGLTAGGVAVMYISHRVHELFRLGGRIAVLRDGILAGIVDPDPDRLGQIVRLMSGKAYAGTDSSLRSQQSVDLPAAPVLLDVRGVSTTVVRDVSFQVRGGEILGVGGLVGSGRSELLRAIAGLDPRETGEVRIGGTAVPPDNPGAALEAGLVMTPEDRKTEGLFQEFSLARNIVIPRLAKIATRGAWVTDAVERRAARPFLGEAGVTPPDPDRPASSLSGGNQQKLLLARALFAGADVLLLDEPTRGIDVAAKEDVFLLMRGLADAGKALVFVSSELEEVARVSDRVLVFHEGRKVCELPGGCSEEEILHAVFRGAVQPGSALGSPGTGTARGGGRVTAVHGGPETGDDRQSRTT